MSSMPASSQDVIDREVRAITAILPAADRDMAVQLGEYAAMTDASADTVIGAVQDGFLTYLEDLSDSEAAALYTDFTLSDLEAARDIGTDPSHLDVVLDGAIRIAERTITGPVADRPDGVYHDGITGGTLNWEERELWVGEEPEELSFTPSVLGVVGHELIHQKQLAANLADRNIKQLSEHERNTMFTAADEAEAHAAYLEIEGIYDPHQRQNYLDELIDSYDDAATIRAHLADSVPGIAPFPGASDALQDSYADHSARLQDAGARLVEPAASQVIVSPTDLEVGRKEAEYAHGSDSLISYREDTAGTGRALAHELIHYNQVHAALGDPDPAFYEALHTVRSAAQWYRDIIGSAGDELFETEPVATSADLNTAAALYAFDGDIDTVVDDTLANEQDLDAFMDAIHAEQDPERYRTVMAPLAERTAAVEALPLDTEGEVYAQFWSLYETVDAHCDAASPEQLYETLHEGWDDPDRESMFETFGYYDNQVDGAGTYIQDGVEQAIETYADRREQAHSDTVAAASVVQDGFDRFFRIGDRLASQ